MEIALPIWQLRDAIVGALRFGNRLVLVAPTGSGKTTQVPQMLLDAGLADATAAHAIVGTPPSLLPISNSPLPGSPSAGKRIVVLQPRRVAARTVAARVAWERGGPLGGEVGYQIRFDDRTGLGTRICFVTEGILLRWLQEDPVLGGVGVLVFDEFHERTLLSDAALALAKRLQQDQRPDLKLAVMSATLDARAVAAYLGGCPILVAPGESFPVAVHYLARPDERPVTEQAAEVVEQVVNAGAAGDILVFMPGKAEIDATIQACRAVRTRESLALIPLHGELPPAEQDLAFAPHSSRKVVVATNVAETSVTIDGIRQVVDSGLARIARYDPERGIGTLFVEPISRASADQRKGRAGRTATGTCHRLWTESGHLNRPERNTPEIQRADLAEVVLLLHSLRIREAARFDWLDQPDPQAVARAEKLLHTLGAVDAGTGELTVVGRQMLRLPMHPRYSRMLVEAGQRGCVRAAALCAALVSGRDLLARLRREETHIAEAREVFAGGQDSDFFTLMRAYQFARKHRFNAETCRRYGIHAQTAREVEQTFQQFLELAATTGPAESPVPRAAEGLAGETGSPGAPQGDEALLRCVTAGFVDQLCARRDQGTLDCDLTEGRTGTLMRASVVQRAPLFVAASIREVSMPGKGAVTLLGLTTAVRREWLEEMFPNQLKATIEHLFDRTHRRVAAVRLVRFRDLVIHCEHQRDVEPAAAGRCLADAYRRGWFELPRFDHAVRQFIARLNLVSAALPELELPALDEAAVTAGLAQAFKGLTLAKEAQAASLLEVVHSRVAPEQMAWLDEAAPATILWPDGRKRRLVYTDTAAASAAVPSSPELQVKLHECFLLKTHPHVCEGRVPVKLWLCAPDGKRLAATTDWPVFKAQEYPRLRPELQRRHPGVGWI